VLGSKRVQADWYVHTPTYVEAIQYSPLTARDARRLLTDWNVVWFEGPDGTLRIATPQGTKPLLYGDYVVRGTVGEAWPIREEVFNISYRRSDGPPWVAPGQTG
jgi:hypothetical protein